jgi:predicted amidophosphoribosyltransferase
VCQSARSVPGFFPRRRLLVKFAAGRWRGRRRSRGSRWFHRPAEGTLWQAILLLKHEQMEPLAADVAVPVPLDRRRERESAYNRGGGCTSNRWPGGSDCRIKLSLMVPTRAQPDKAILPLEERWEFVRVAFATRPGSQVDNLRVLLVDDV